MAKVEGLTKLCFWESHYSHSSILYPGEKMHTSQLLRQPDKVFRSNLQWLGVAILQGLVIQRVDNAIQRINHYPVEKCWQNNLHYLLDIEDNTWFRGDMKFIFECSNQ